MSSTCYEPEGSSSGRQMNIQVWYGTFYMHHVNCPIPWLYIQLSSWRWTLRFETCRRHQKIKN